MEDGDLKLTEARGKYRHRIPSLLFFGCGL